MDVPYRIVPSAATQTFLLAFPRGYETYSRAGALSAGDRGLWEDGRKQTLTVATTLWVNDRNAAPRPGQTWVVPAGSETAQHNFLTEVLASRITH